MGALTRKMTYDEEEQSTFVIRTPSTGTATTNTAPRIVMTALAAVLLVMVVVAMFSDTTNTHNRQVDTPAATNLAVKCASAQEECDPGGPKEFLGYKKINCCPGSSCADQGAGSTGVLRGICVGSTSSRPASCSKCSPIQDPTGAGSYDKGTFVPKYINRPGVYVPNDDPAETNGWCLDCSYPSAHDECKAAGCAIGPPPPPKKYSDCVDTYINGQTDCKVCAEGGKVCVSGKCLDCFTKENDEVCRAQYCGPACGGGYTPVPGDPGYNPNPGVGHCRSCSKDGNKVCVDSTGLFGQIECLDCKKPLTHQDKLKCEISMCRKRSPHEKCAKFNAKCDPGDTSAGIKIIECCEGLQCIGAGRAGYSCA